MRQSPIGVLLKQSVQGYCNLQGLNDTIVLAQIGAISQNDLRDALSPVSFNRLMLILGRDGNSRNQVASHFHLHAIPDRGGQGPKIWLICHLKGKDSLEPLQMKNIYRK